MPVCIPYLDLRISDEGELREILQRIETVLRVGPLLNGPDSIAVENQVAELSGCRFGIGVGSGTDALILALRVLGIGPGDEVVVPPLSFVATANAVRSVGAEPVFADIDETLCLDPASIEQVLGPRTRAVVPVHWAGKICRMEAILPIARQHGLFVVEDAAQAFGATRHGRAAGCFGDVGCFSMNVMKVLGAIGEAGMIVTDDEGCAARLRTLRYHGVVDRDYCFEASHNARMDTIQAAALMVRLGRFESALAKRRANAAYYTDRLSGHVQTPFEEPGCYDVYYSYGIGTDRRDALKAFMTERGIEVKFAERLLIPEQKAYGGQSEGLDRARAWHSRQLLLPVSPALTTEQRAIVADAVLEFHVGRR